MPHTTFPFVTTMGCNSTLLTKMKTLSSRAITQMMAKTKGCTRNDMVRVAM